VPGKVLSWDGQGMMVLCMVVMQPTTLPTYRALRSLRWVFHWPIPNLLQMRNVRRPINRHKRGRRQLPQRTAVQDQNNEPKNTIQDAEWRGDHQRPDARVAAA
jgi:hypothetical protein